MYLWHGKEMEDECIRYTAVGIIVNDDSTTENIVSLEHLCATRPSIVLYARQHSFSLVRSLSLSLHTHVLWSISSLFDYEWFRGCQHIGVCYVFVSYVMCMKKKKSKENTANTELINFGWLFKCVDMGLSIDCDFMTWLIFHFNFFLFVQNSLDRQTFFR